MIKISKTECELLRQQGVNIGENGISHTAARKSRKKTYYLCESLDNIELLNKIRTTN